MVACAMAALIAAPRGAAAAPGCRVAVNGEVAFGTYEVFSPSPRPAIMRIRIDCAGAAPQIAISRGNSGTYAARELRSANDALRYNLYVDPGYRVIWGDGTEGTRMPAAAGNAELVVFARIPPGQDVAPGTYTDSLVVTVFF